MREGEADRPRRSWLAWLGVLAALLLAVQTGRAALVAAEGERRPALAHAVWPSHPLPQVTLSLAAIGAAAAKGQNPPADALERMRAAGRYDPLGFQPLLVAATDKLAAGDEASGEKLLQAVLEREPRSTAAHFLLADLYVRQQRIPDALGHVAVLGRRVRGNGAQAFAGALAAYLRSSGDIRQVALVLQKDPSLRSGVMLSLAQDVSPASAATLRALARPGDAGQDWYRIAFERQLGGGNIGEARALLAAAGVRGGGTALSPLAGGIGVGPLSWRLPAGANGVAEPSNNGSLQLVYFGRADAALAEHLLLLPAGRYQLASQFAGSISPGTFEWRVSCPQGNRQIASIPIASGASVRMIDVPAACPAQRLSLWGRMGDFPRTSSAELLRATLSPAGGIR